MPEESKKNQQKGKNDPKEQRRRRQGRQPACPAEKKPEKQLERSIEKHTKEPEKPTHPPPGPEFYKNLKRETDEILKITEEANTRYKKKEIQSNWAKYEMPVESYEEIDEQENIGADYEKLILAPAAAGGYFQFKHEKSWDADIGPSLYDKYFDINMDLLSLAVSTIPFYERNSLEQPLFNENDIMTMNHRATKFKQKYYNDKKYNTPDSQTKDKILSSLQNNDLNPITIDSKHEDKCIINDIIHSEEPSDIREIAIVKDKNNTEKKYFEKETVVKSMPKSSSVEEKVMQEIMHVEEIKSQPCVNFTKISNNNDNSEVNKTLLECDQETNKQSEIVFTKIESPKKDEVVEEIKIKANKHISTAKETTKNPVIESPEDLEKWLDDFLDG